MKRDNPQSDIKLEDDVGAAYVMSVIFKFRGWTCIERPTGNHPEWDFRTNVGKTTEQKNDYLNALTTNFVAEDKCLKGSKADLWHYGMPHLDVESLIQDKIKDMYSRLKNQAEYGCVPEAREMAKNLFKTLLDYKDKLILDVYEWDFAIFKKFVLDGKFPKSYGGDDNKALCHIISKSRVEGNKILTVQNNDLPRDYRKLFYKKMSQEMELQMEKAKENSK